MSGVRIRVGIGGWVFPPWRGVFYPPGLPQARELAHASRQVTAIEINGTFYGSQKPASFRRWHDETPEDFVFSLKGPRFVTHRSDLATAGPSIDRFFTTGVLELRDKLGPVLWQFAPRMAFDEAGFAAFLELLPQQLEGRAIRHVVEVRHRSFAAPSFTELLRAHRVVVALVDDDNHPAFEAITGAGRCRSRMAAAPSRTCRSCPSTSILIRSSRARPRSAASESRLRNGTCRASCPTQAGPIRAVPVSVRAEITTGTANCATPSWSPTAQRTISAWRRALAASVDSRAAALRGAGSIASTRPADPILRANGTVHSPRLAPTSITTEPGCRNPRTAGWTCGGWSRACRPRASSGLGTCTRSPVRCNTNPPGQSRSSRARRRFSRQRRMS